MMDAWWGRPAHPRAARKQIGREEWDPPSSSRAHLSDLKSFNHVLPLKRFTTSGSSLSCPVPGAHGTGRKIQGARGMWASKPLLRLGRNSAII